MLPCSYSYAKGVYVLFTFKFLIQPQSATHILIIYVNIQSDIMYIDDMVGHYYYRDE